MSEGKLERAGRAARKAMMDENKKVEKGIASSRKEYMKLRR
jgi:hypothetical protein